jgi:hypothetical protein
MLAGSSRAATMNQPCAVVDEACVDRAADSAVRRLSARCLDTFEAAAVRTLLRTDLRTIALPSLMVHASLRARFGQEGSVRLASDPHLDEALQRRGATLGAFIERASQAFRELRQNPQSSRWIGRSGPVWITALTTDTHQRGACPLLVEDATGRAVLKFADPRPWSLLAACLKELSGGLGLCLSPPPVVASTDRACYLSEFIAPGSVGDHPADIMTALGALTAMAHCLRCTDLHIENVVVTKGHAVVVDPECILYNFEGPHGPRTLLETGLVSPEMAVSAWRGGIEINGPSTMFEPAIDAQGHLRYVREMRSYPNLARCAGSCVDPGRHAPAFLHGFRAAQEWAINHRDRLRNLVEHFVEEDFRVRVLIRETRLYAAAIHMLNLPAVDDYRAHAQSTLRRLRRSGRLQTRVASPVFDAETEDLIGRDVPYFWAYATQRWLWHRRGALQRLRCARSIKDQALYDLKHLRRRDIAAQLALLADFLRKPPGSPSAN